MDRALSAYSRRETEWRLLLVEVCPPQEMLKSRPLVSLHRNIGKLDLFEVGSFWVKIGWLEKSHLMIVFLIKRETSERKDYEETEDNFGKPRNWDYQTLRKEAWAGYPSQPTAAASPPPPCFSLLAPELWDNKFVLFKSSSLWDSVIAIPPN